MRSVLMLLMVLFGTIHSIAGELIFTTNWSHTSDGNFVASVGKSGGTAVTWEFENGHLIVGNSVNVGSESGLNGTNQIIKIIYDLPELVTQVQLTGAKVVGHLDFSNLTHMLRFYCANNPGLNEVTFPDLNPSAKVSTAYFHDCNISVINNLNGLVSFAGYIRLQNNALTSFSYTANNLANSPVTELNLSGNQISNPNLSGFTNLGGQILFTSNGNGGAVNPNLGIITLPSQGAYSSKITRFWADRSAVTDLVNLNGLTNISGDISLEYNQLTSFNYTVMNIANSAITSLDLQGNQISTPDLSGFTNLGGGIYFSQGNGSGVNPNLGTITFPTQGTYSGKIFRVWADGCSVSELINLNGLTNLAGDLRLENNALTSFNYTAQNTANSAITGLNLFGNQITDPDLSGFTNLGGGIYFTQANGAGANPNLGTITFPSQGPTAQNISRIWADRSNVTNLINFNGLTKLAGDIRLEHNQLTNFDYTASNIATAAVTNLQLQGNQIANPDLSGLSNLSGSIYFSTGSQDPNPNLGNVVFPTQSATATNIIHLYAAHCGITELGNLEGLSKINGDVRFNNNSIKTLNFNSSASITALLIENNNLTFESIIPYFTQVSGTYTFVPQGNFGEVRAEDAVIGSPFEITLGIDLTVAPANTYTWYKDGGGTPFQSTSIGTLPFSDMSELDAGIYTCSVTNTAAPGLTLTSEPITLGVTACPTWQCSSDGLSFEFGKIAIGSATFSTEFNLLVSGGILTDRVKVVADPTLYDPWPDYVFEKSYHIKPLTEIESYINENKHLPDVQSAQQVEENGVDLLNMNMLLLKKVEELTVYLIDQNKRIIELENQILNDKSK